MPGCGHGTSRTGRLIQFREAYSYILVGGRGAVAELARPVEDTLYFAGEATQEGFSGTVASTIASGYRAAAPW